MGVLTEGFSKKEHDLMRLESVKDVLFQVLLLDDIENRDKIYAKLCTIMLSRED